MSRAENLIGKQFGYLTVLSRAENDKHGKTKWLCQCSYKNCKNQKIVRSEELKKGKTKSCSCLNLDYEDLSGKTFGNLLVIKRIPYTKSKRGGTFWLCVCCPGICNNEVKVLSHNLKNGGTKSCSCKNAARAKKQFTKHGRSKTSEYWIWLSMKRRCSLNNKNKKEFNYYAGRNIKICDEWKNSFDQFYKDMGSKPFNNASIERINNNGNYEPNNCKWATKTEQAHNTRIHKKNKTGIKGVRITNDNKFATWIGVNNKSVYVGTFLSLEEAAAARKNAEQKYWIKN